MGGCLIDAGLKVVGGRAGHLAPLLCPPADASVSVTLRQLSGKRLPSETAIIPLTVCTDDNQYEFPLPQTLGYVGGKKRGGTCDT